MKQFASGENRFGSFRLACRVLLFSISAQAQPALVDTPGLGFVWDAPNATVRPIRGIPGASVLGNGLAPGAPLKAAFVSPQHDLALAIASDDGRVLRIRLSAGGASDVVEGAYPLPARIVFAPSGRVALLIGSEAQVVSSLDGSPTVQGVSVPPMDGPPAAAAVADAGLMILSSGSSIGAPVWLLADNGPIRLALPGTIVASAFRQNSADAVAATQSGDIYVIRNAGPNAEIQQVYTGDETTSDPVAVQFTPDGSRAVLANARTREGP
jgi:hypothetical protein